jgi:hypothetical protein
MKTRLYHLLLLLGILGFAALTPRAGAMVYWRVSVKVILDSNGNWPVGTSATNGSFSFDPYNYDSVQRIQQVFAEYNKILDSMGWGFRFDLREVVALSGVSEWFGVNARDPDNRTQLEIKAKLQPGKYAYRLDALNLYVNNSSSGISGGHLPLLGDVIFIGATGYWTLGIHEIGHALGLCHTFSCDCNGCGSSGSCDAGFDSDNIADTIRDSPCWNTQNDIAVPNFNRIYSILTAGQRRQVDDIFLNIMSYHNNHLVRFTHDQWERIVDISNFDKRNVASGKTVFVDRSNPCLRPEDLAEPFKTLASYTPGWSWGTRNGLGVTLDPRSPPPGAPALPCPPAPAPCSVTVCLGGPFKNVADAVNSATDGDRLQIKAGNYNQTMRINKRITLATDRGTVAIGRP